MKVPNSVPYWITGTIKWFDLAKVVSRMGEWQERYLKAWIGARP